MNEQKNIIAPPVVTKDAKEKLLNKMYISNVQKRLRDLNNPTDIDRKRWIWELIQNAKDTIVSDTSRNSINIKIEIDGDIVRFRHNGNPFTADARFGLLYKYSEDKENQESTGRFGTGFLTTHCLSKVVSIESNMYSNEEKTSICGFSVTMYRDGQIEAELIEGLEKMRSSEKYYSEPFEWTTFTYHIKTDSGRKAIQLGIENFYQNIAQTMLFCKELSSVELNDNGKITIITRKPIVDICEGIKCAEFGIEVDNESYTRRFLFSSYVMPNEDLSNKYRSERSIRIDAAIEVNEKNEIISNKGKTSHFCVLPLVGVENQLDEPIIVNSPDFEPDSERQSLILNGQDWNDETNTITEAGINKELIYKNIFPLYEKLVKYVSENKYGNLYELANGLKKAKEHDKLDKDWYCENVIKRYREVLLNVPLVESYNSSELKLLKDCVIAKESKKNDELLIFNLLNELYPQKVIKENSQWAQCVWNDNLEIFDTKELCSKIEKLSNLESLQLEEEKLFVWYNRFIEHILAYNELLLKEYALLPNMNGDFLKKDAENFKQGENINDLVISLLNDLGKNVKPFLLHNKIQKVKLDSKYTSQSFSADINKLVGDILNDDSISDKLQKLSPLLSFIPNADYEEDFIKRRNDFLDIAMKLFSLNDIKVINDNSLLENAWKGFDWWFVNYVLDYLDKIGDLSKLPNKLDAKWLNSTLKSLKVEKETLNKYSVIPNQEGKFCKHKELYKDLNIPECLKVDVFSKINLNYKSILLHKEIEDSNLDITQQKDISDFTKDLNIKLKPLNGTSCFYFNGAHYSFSQDDIEEVALYMLSIMPQENVGRLYNVQYGLFSVASCLLQVSQKTYVIEDMDENIWNEVNIVVSNIIIKKIESLKNIDALNKYLNNVGEENVFEVLNAFYTILSNENIVYNKCIIFPNQHGNFKPFSELRREKGEIDEILKDIIFNIDNENNDYRTQLMDNRCVLQPQQLLDFESAAVLIDQKIYELYEIPSRWTDEKYINASQLLIESWGEKHDRLFEEKFPRTYPNKEKILMNVVWKKEKRELMMSVSNKLTDEQLKFVIENSSEINNLSDINKKLLDENLKLQSELSEIKKANGIKTNESIEIEIETPNGKELQKITESQYLGLSSEDVKQFVSEAKMAVVKYFKELEARTGVGYKFDEERINMDSYSILYGVSGPDGNEIPIVVHSYKGPQYRDFDLNWYDWQMLSRENSMLFVLTVTGLQCLPLYALPVRNFNISIGNEVTNESRAALLTLASVASQYTQLSFDFGNNMPQGFKDPLPFDFVPEKLNECITSIKQVCDKNIPQIAGCYNSGKNVPLIRSTVGYSVLMKEIEEGNARDIFDAPINNIQAPSVGTSFID